MPAKNYTCGIGDGPISGQSIFTAKFLKNCLVNFIIVNNTPENQLDPNPDFQHNYIYGTIDRGTNVWSAPDKLIIDYTPCKNCN